VNVVRAVPPAEVDIRAEQYGEENARFGSAIAGHISDCWNRAKFAKTELTERLLKCERQRRGVYDPDRALEIAKTGGSDIYMMLTDIKCRAAESWIKDVLINMRERPFDLVPTEQPIIPPEVKMDIVRLVQAEAQEFLAMGARLHPDTFSMRLSEVHDQLLLKVKEEAKERARRMGNLIEDQLHKGSWEKAFNDFISDFVTYPTAILKGPTVRKKKRLEWGPEFVPIVVSDFNREVERVSPYDIYPAPNSGSVDDNYLIQRHRLNREQLKSFMGVPGYSDNEIAGALEAYGRGGLKSWVQGDEQRDDLEGKPHAEIEQGNLIEAIEFWGPASGQMLIEWGMDDVDPLDEYEVNAWMVGNHVIKCVINPDPLGRRPYEITSWENIPGSFWGTALPEIMRDVQILCNGAARALANNMAIASGPQVEVNVDRLAEGEDLTQMYPWKIWQTTSDRTGGGQAGIRFFVPDMKAAELMGVYQQFARQADEVTGIPNYVYGSATVSGAGRTASGLSMLMDNAAKGIKAAIASIDKVVSGVVHRFYVHNMMYHDDPFVKGDFNIVAKGAMGLLAREQLQIRRNEFLAATANPVDLQIIGADGRAYLLREVAASLQMDTDKIVPTPEAMKHEQEKQAMIQQAAMQMQMQMQPQQPQTLDAAGNPAGGADMQQAAPQQPMEGA
jgi:hypothetical protein